MLGLFWRLLDLSFFEREFLLKQSNARTLRTLSIPAYRGIVMDALGTPLAVSTAVQSVWINPKYFTPTESQLASLAELLEVSLPFIENKLRRSSKREFVYLKRAIPPPVSKKIDALNIPGLFFQEEFRRYYPEEEVTAHVVGFTNIDDQGQEGIELAFNDWLGGSAGAEQVVKDRLGNVIAQLGLIREPVQGKNIQLSIDHRIQYLAYEALKETVDQYQAKSGSAVVLDVETGEVLAMVNQPSYNPNNRSHTKMSWYRNRAVTDMFEPGSVIKPFTIALALKSGKYTPDTKIDTQSGWMKIGGYRIRDDLNYGIVTLTELLQKSSNIAAAKILLSLEPADYWDLLKSFGFGERTASGFPGEASGQLTPQTAWVPSVVATLSYGYGLSVTTLQLAHAYSIIASGGVSHPVSLLKRDEGAAAAGERILPENIANTLTEMLEAVVKSGTGRRAQILGYRVAGKTGTAYVSTAKGYDHHRYMSSFAGMAPVSHPKLVVVVAINEPQGKHFGALVAAPAFAKIMAGALRLLNIAPDGIN